MGLDWSTFLLEVANFLILVWILKRFLYAPVKAAIERRQAAAREVLEQAQARLGEAERLRTDYENRQQAWKRERSEARAALEREMGAERARRLAAIEQEVGKRSEQARILDERRREEAERHSQQSALELAAGFGSRLLARVADTSLEARLVEMALEDLETLSVDQRQSLGTAVRDAEAEVRVRSAYRLDDSQRARLATALHELAGAEVSCVFEEDAGLIAGLRIEAGALVLGANLRDELRFFAEAAS